MKSENSRNIWIVAFAVVTAVTVVSCGKKSDQDEVKAVGAAQQAGINADRVASNTVDAANRTAVEIQEASDKAVNKAGEVLEKAGEDLEKAGENMQK